MQKFQDWSFSFRLWASAVSVLYLVFKEKTPCCAVKPSVCGNWGCIWMYYHMIFTHIVAWQNTLTNLVGHQEITQCPDVIAEGSPCTQECVSCSCPQTLSQMSKINDYNSNSLDCEPGLITPHQQPTSLMLLWLYSSRLMLRVLE